jgi:hypothetical protein
MLNDDTLLNIFTLYPQDIVEVYEDVASWPEWDNARWWYKFVHVCRRWRHLVLSSPVRLGLHLVCTYGTPVADMLAHSPPLPLIIHYLDANRYVSVEDEEAILLALQDRDRVRRIGLKMPATKLLKSIIAMDGQFPILERLFIWPRMRHDNMSLMLSTRFQAPHLRMLSLDHVVLPLRSPLLTSTVGLVELGLWDMPLLASFHPSDLIARLASMTQLESLSIGFKLPVPARDVERQLSLTPIRTLVTLPNLRLCFFQGGSAYLEGLLARIDIPLLEVLNIWFYNQLIFTVPHLLQFMGRTENLRFGFARLSFYRENVILTADGGEQIKINPFSVTIGCRHIDWQVSAAAQIFGALVPALSVVERLSLSYGDHDVSSEERNEVDRNLWREVLRPFSSVKVLHMDHRLIRNLSSSLQPEDGEPALEVLPQLKELIYFNTSASDVFTSFIQSRQMVGHRVTLTHLLHRPSEWR